MRKQDLAHAVATATKMTDAQGMAAVNAMIQAIEDALAGGEEVTISGFGSFRVVERPARDGRSPRTGEPVKIPARKSPVFRPGAQLKRVVGGED